MTNKTADYDLCVIGGGINGAGIARDAAARGLSVLLVEADDLASATSSASSKLIHGGLRYLEYYDFKLVREALIEREVLLRNAPHIIWPLEFVLPHEEGLRPVWLIRLGLFLYDNLGGRKTLPSSRYIDFKTHKYGADLQDHYTSGFSYADCWADDARLVVLNALAAHENGAHIRTRTKCTKLESQNGIWHCDLEDVRTNAKETKTARMVVNAAGPWVRQILDQNNITHKHTPNVRLVKGSHIVVPKLYDGNHCFTLQRADKRIVFTIPYEGKYTLIGTTDVEIHDDPRNVSISEEETNYLCEAVNRRFKKTITPADIIWSYSGVRPLYDENEGDNASSATRDYKIVTDKVNGAKIISIFGGKITTYRHLAEDVVDKLTNKPRWTARKPLPGGHLPSADFEKFVAIQKQIYKRLPELLIRRYARTYGTCMNDFLDGIKTEKDLGQHFGDDLYEAEINYLITHEWAQTAEDILWRRTKKGLHASRGTQQNLTKFLEKR